MTSAEGKKWVNLDDAMEFALWNDVDKGAMTHLYRRLCRYLNPRWPRIRQARDIEFRGELLYPEVKRVQFELTSFVNHFLQPDNLANFKLEDRVNDRMIEILMGWVAALQAESKEVEI